MTDAFFPFSGPLGQIFELAQTIYSREPKLAAYLPAIYHPEAERKMGPLWALLLVMEDNFDSVSRVIDDIDRYFDIWRAPWGQPRGEPDFVTWLGSWVGLIPQQEWSEQKKRYALSIAVKLHRYRGTKNGIKYMLALFFEIDVEIEEWTWPPGMQIDVKNTIGVDTRIDDQFNINFCFQVTWTPQAKDLEGDIKEKVGQIRDMIDREKPAHTFCYLKVTGFEDEELNAFGENLGDSASSKQQIKVKKDSNRELLKKMRKSPLKK